MRDSERGDGLIDAIVAVAITSVVLLTVMGAAISAAHRLGPDPIRDALAQRTQSELRLALDAMKYQGASLVPAIVSTTVPLPDGSLIAVREALETSANADGSIAISVSASADSQSSENAVASATAPKPAPAPSSTIPAPNNGNSPI